MHGFTNSKCSSYLPITTKCIINCVFIKFSKNHIVKFNYCIKCSYRQYNYIMVDMYTVQIILFTLIVLHKDDSKSKYSKIAKKKV